MFVLPDLKKPYSAYEPYIDEKTMQVHHQGHHQKYVETLNRALVESDLNIDRIEDIFQEIENFPEIIRNNAGAHYNHTVFWSTLNDTMTSPSLELLHALEREYGVLDDFKALFTKSALELFGSGWVWLVLKDDGKLAIVQTKNQDTPLMSDQYQGYPLFGLDLWEHAYYLKHQNRRVDYVRDFWAVLDWDEVSRRFSEKPEMNEI